MMFYGRTVYCCDNDYIPQTATDQAYTLVTSIVPSNNFSCATVAYHVTCSIDMKS